jgi:hypothetical protein
LQNNTPYALIDTLVERLQPVIDNYWAWWTENSSDGTEGNEQRHTPVIHAQYLPIEMVDNDKDPSRFYPLVVVANPSGSVASFNPSSSTLTIQFIFGSRNSNTDMQGWREANAMLWAVMQNLITNRVVLGYTLQAPISYENIQATNPPFFQAVLNTVWQGMPPAFPVLTNHLFRGE